MAELNPRDRLQPFLLDRLTDDTPGQIKESRDKNAMTPQQLKVALMRDLGWLLNTPAPVAEDGIGEFTQVVTSVINFGIPDLTGITASGVSGTSLERNVLKAIQTFEPRIEKRSISVRMLSDEEAGTPNTLGLEIRGEVIANPLPESLYIKTEVDLETGQFALKDRPNG
ncbi:MAG TPA: type VI secretion system baseplate subunit TssE [Phycisphaerae bacterium]|jgi:type VI secretion system protein ImpF